MSFIDRLTYYRKLAGLNQKDLADKIGISVGQISKYERGLSEPRADVLAKIANALNVEIDNLIGYQIEKWDDETPLDDRGVINVTLLDEHNKDSSKKILINVGDRTLQALNINPKNVICYKIAGNSMQPIIPDGALVGIDTANTNIVDGKIYAVVIENELARVKQLYRLPNNRVRLRSFNRDEYEDEEYSLDDVEIIGNVFWYSSALIHANYL